MTTKHCANGRGCAAVAALGEPAKLSRYNQEGVCSECLLRARRESAEEEDMRNALRAARKKKPSAKDKAKGKRGRGREPEPEAQATLPRLVKDLEGIASTLRIQRRQFADTARTLAQTGEDLARVAEALADQAPKESRRSEAKVKHGDTKKPAEDRQWLTVSEVARRHAVRPKTVYGWIYSGELAATKFGPQSTRVRASELARFEREGIEG